MATLLELTWAKQRAREIEVFAAEAENWYRPGPGVKTPGNDPRHVLQNQDIRAVFSWTVAPDDVRRHMSVSVKTPGRVPSPVVVFTLAHYFGFTGAVLTDGLVQDPAPGWVFTVDKTENCVVVQEVIHGGKF